MKYVAPNDLYLVWDYVKAGLEHLLKRAPDKWLPEHIFHHIMAGNFYLHMTQKEGENTGFVVLQVTQGWQGLEMHVFAAYSLDAEIMDYAFEQVKELAKKMNVKFLKFTSNRKGWEKRALELGYTYENTSYEIAL